MPTRSGHKSKRAAFALLVLHYVGPTMQASPGGDDPSAPRPMSHSPSVLEAGPRSSWSTTQPASPKATSNQCAPSFSPLGELNTHLPPWLRFDGQYQGRWEDGFSGKQFAPGSQDVYFVNRIRVGLTVRPADWLRFHVEGQDIRAFDKRPSRTSGFYDLLDVRQAYMEVGDAEKGSVAVKAGRQIFYWGEGRLVADSRWSMPGRSFDAVRVTLRHGGYRLDAFAASIVQIIPATNTGFSTPRLGNNIHGLYGGIEK